MERALRSLSQLRCANRLNYPCVSGCNSQVGERAACCCCAAANLAPNRDSWHELARGNVYTR